MGNTRPCDWQEDGKAITLQTQSYGPAGSKIRCGSCGRGALQPLCIANARAAGTDASNCHARSTVATTHLATHLLLRRLQVRKIERSTNQHVNPDKQHMVEQSLGDLT